MASVSPFRFRVASVASAKIGYYLMKVMAELGCNEDADDEEDEESAPKKKLVNQKTSSIR